MSNEFPRLSTSVQWPERRSFERVYTGNPFRQANYVQTLLGHRAVFAEFGISSEEGRQVVDAVDTIIRSFAENYPEFLEESCEVDHEAGGGVYEADPRLLNITRKIIEDDR